MSTTDDLTAAIADLAKAEMAFTTDIWSDGKKAYIVDSVALAEDELVLLHRKGALTQTGIRHYLAYRGALGTQTYPTPHISFVTFFQFLVGAAPLSDDKRNHLENCAECQAIAEELTGTDQVWAARRRLGCRKRKWPDDFSKCGGNNAWVDRVLLFALWLLGLVSSYFEFHGISAGTNVERKLAKGSGLGGI